MTASPSAWNRYGWWLLGSLLVAALIVLAGLKWMDGFAASAAASAAAIFASIPVTVLIVESIVDRRRAEQWARVREQTGRSIEGLAQQAAFDFHVALTPVRRREIPSPVTMPLGGDASTLRRISRALRERHAEPDPDPAVIRLHDTVKQPLFYLGDGSSDLHKRGSDTRPALRRVRGADARMGPRALPLRRLQRGRVVDERGRHSERARGPRRARAHPCLAAGRGSAPRGSLRRPPWSNGLG